MSADNRTLLNGCESAADSWAGDDSVSDNSLTGLFYQGSQGLSTQLSNALERMTCSTIGGTRDLSDASVWFLVKDNLASTKTAGGHQIVLDDGTDEIGFYTNGNDDPPLSLETYFFCLKLDVSNRSALSNNAYAGSAGALTVTAITGVGYGSIHTAKAQGAVDNVFMDAFRFISNNSYALTINGGTVGTPETFADVAGDDVTNGWGMISNLQGSKFDINASFEWGDTANANSYFVDSDFQLFIDARDMGVGNFIIRTIAGTGTNVLELTNGLFQNLGTPAVWDLTDVDMTELKFTSCTWTDAGTISFPTQSIGNRFANDCVFNNCAQVTFDSMDADGCIFNGTTDANGAVLLSTTPADADNQENATFNSDGTGHAIEINLNTASLTTYSISGLTVDGYAGQSGTAGNRVFLIDNALDGDVTINISGGTATNVVGGGSGFSYEAAAGYTGVITINQTVTLTVTVTDSDGAVVEGARVRIENASTGAQIAQGTTNASGVFTDATYNYGGDLSVRTKVRLKGYKPFRTLGTIISTGISVGVTLQTDTIVDLP